MNAKPEIDERAVTDVVAVKGGFLLVTWKGGAMGLVDLRTSIANLPAFEFLRDPDAFSAVQVESDGSAVFWRDHDGDVIDIDADSLWLRRKALSPVPAGGRSRSRVIHGNLQPA